MISYNLIRYPNIRIFCASLKISHTYLRITVDIKVCENVRPQICGDFPRISQGVENVRPQISLGFPKDMLGIFHFKITHKHVTFDLKMQRQTEAADQQSSLQMAHNERIIQGLLNVRTPLQGISAIQDSKATRPT
jgi:hypothetical protein